MLFAIISDIHSNIEALNAVIKKCKEFGVEKYVCLGDIVGYNASPIECIDVLRSLNLASIIKGNHDEYIGKYIPIEGINKFARESVLWTRSILSKDDRAWLANLPLKFVNIKEGFSVIHATLDSPESWSYILDVHNSIDSFNYQMTQLCFFGHTHLPRVFVKEVIERGTKYEIERVSLWEQIPPDHEGINLKLEKGKKYLINVGSIGQPRDGDTRASFVIYDSKQKVVKRYAVSYDIKSAQQRILESGLPSQLAYRLSYGH